ncbi:hypothetical protein JTB14_015521 [Gonioctena quinquepunctata]|nr:hypothetical protein JTB14_015521 [Gonioctena quinquepunctata]
MDILASDICLPSRASCRKEIPCCRTKKKRPKPDGQMSWMPKSIRKVALVILGSYRIVSIPECKLSLKNLLNLGHDTFDISDNRKENQLFKMGPGMTLIELESLPERLLYEAAFENVYTMLV